MVMSEEMLADGWVEHDGSSNPYPGRGLIEVMLRDGRLTWSRFGFWFWCEGAPLNIDIVAYRPAPSSVERIAA